MRQAASIYQEGFDTELARYAGKRLRFFIGSPAASRGTFPSGTVLATIACPAPLFNPSTWDEATKKLTAAKVSSALQDVSADASGNVGSFGVDDNGAFVADGTVGLAGSGADMIVDRVDVSAGAPLVVQSLSRTRTIS